MKKQEKTRHTTQQATSRFLGQLSFDRWTCEMNWERLNANVKVESARVGWGRKGRTIPLTLQSTVMFCFQLQLLSRTIFAIVVIAVMLFFFFFKMQLSVFSICIAVLLSLVTIKVSCKAPEEKKIPKTLPHYCGVKFRKVWEMCCDHGCRHNAYKRVLGEKL